MTGSGSNEFVSPGAFPMWDGNGGNYQLQIGGDGSGNYIIGDSTGMGAYKSMLYFGMGWRDAGIGTGSGEQPTVWVRIQMATEPLHSTDQGILWVEHRCDRQFDGAPKFQGRNLRLHQHKPDDKRHNRQFQSCARTSAARRKKFGRNWFASAPKAAGEWPLAMFWTFQAWFLP